MLTSSTVVSKYVDCPSCGCLIRGRERRCPFCGTSQRLAVAPLSVLVLGLSLGLALSTGACRDDDVGTGDDWADGVTYAGPDPTSVGWNGDDADDGASVGATSTANTTGSAGDGMGATANTDAATGSSGDGSTSTGTSGATETGTTDEDDGGSDSTGTSG